MDKRIACCRCGQLRAICRGEPSRVSVCHCLNCQQRSGSAFAVQARFPDERVTLVGEFREWSDVSVDGQRAIFRFCPSCGTTVAYVADAVPGLTAIPVGTFADPKFMEPSVSGYEQRRHPWVAILGSQVVHFD